VIDVITEQAEARMMRASRFTQLLLGADSLCRWFDSRDKAGGD